MAASGSDRYSSGPDFWKPKERKQEGTKTRGEGSKFTISKPMTGEGEGIKQEMIDELMELMQEALPEEVKTIDESAMDVLARCMHDDIRSILTEAGVVAKLLGDRNADPQAAAAGRGLGKTINPENVRVALKQLGWPPFRSIDRPELLPEVLVEMCNDHNKVPFDQLM